MYVIFRLHEAKESEIRYNSKDPVWNETFVFANIASFEVRQGYADLYFKVSNERKLRRHLLKGQGTLNSCESYS